MSSTTFSSITIGETFQDEKGRRYIKLPRYRSDFTDKEYNAINLDELVIEDALVRVNNNEVVTRVETPLAVHTCA